MPQKVSLGLRLKQIATYVLRAAKRYLGLNKTISVSQRASKYRGYWENAAKDLSAEFIPILDDYWEIRHNGRSFKFANDIIPINLS